MHETLNPNFQNFLLTYYEAIPVTKTKEQEKYNLHEQEEE